MRHTLTVTAATSVGIIDFPLRDHGIQHWLATSLHYQR
jgi:hypothetical protein